MCYTVYGVRVYCSERERETYYLSDKHVPKKKKFPTICSVQPSRRLINLPSLLIFDSDSASAASLAHEDNRQHTDKIKEYHRVSQTLNRRKPSKMGGVPRCTQCQIPFPNAHPADSCLSFSGSKKPKNHILSGFHPFHL